MSCQYIYIHKGDDTDWAGEQLLEIHLVPHGIDLSSMTASFILGTYTKSAIPLADNVFTIDLSAAVTGDFPFGPINGTIKIYDSLGKVKTVVNDIPFYVTNEVITVQNQELSFELPQVSINVNVGGEVSYNNLSNKPSINGVTIQGDKTGSEYGLASSSDLDLKVSKSGDTMTGDLVLSSGVGIETPNAKIHEVNNKLVLGNKDNSYGLYVNPNGTGAAFVSSNGNADVLKSTDLRNSYDPDSTYPITGKGVSSAISTKQNTITGAATTITSSNLTASKALVSDANGKVAVSSVTSTELGYVSGVTSSIQTQITNNANSISTIEEKIPSQASSTNQLADKNFVNSSIATNTANFIGTFSNVSDLEDYSGTVTNNDYAFVINSVVTDNGNDWATFAALDAYDKSLLTEFDYAWVVNGSKFDLYRFDIIQQEWTLRVQDTHKEQVTLNTAYNRYKATVVESVVTWAYEYTLNNSSFTASQWAAINSGITSSLVTQIGTNTGNISSLQTSKQDTLVSGTNIKTINSNSLLGSGDLTIDSLPSQTGQSGKFLTTDGTDASWATVDALPSQTGQSGKFLTTDGTTASWAAVSSYPTLTWYTGITGTTVTISDTSGANLVKIYKNGILLEPTADYSISGTTLTLVTALTATDKITVEVF